MEPWWLWSIGGTVLAVIGLIAVKRSSASASVPAPLPDPDKKAPPTSAPKTPGAPAAASSPVPQPAPTPGSSKPSPMPDQNSDHPYEIKAGGAWQFWTPPEYAVEGSPRVDAPFGGTVTAAPLKDSRTGGYARLRYRDALAVAARLGGRLMTANEQDALAKVGIMLKPVTLPGSSPTLMAKGYKAGSPMMSSLEWAKVEDELIDKQLVDMSWDGHTIVNNAGKDWIGGAPAGRAINRGWYDKSAKYGMIQTTGGAHDDSHTDYSQLTRIVWPAA